MVLPLPALAAQVTVKPGETLSDIAARHRVSVSTLMKVNGISDPDLVEAGRTLTLPGGAARPRTAGGSLTVAPGETLSEIADRHGITVSRLMQLNGLSKADHIEAGQKLVVPSASRSASPASGFNRKASEHVVRSGESLSQIAEGYGIPMTQLIAINRISDPNLVESGTRLRLKPTAAPSVKPAAKPAAAARPAATPRPAAKPAPTARPAPANQPAPAVVRATPAPAARPQPAVVAAAPASQHGHSDPRQARLAQLRPPAGGLGQLAAHGRQHGRAHPQFPGGVALPGGQLQRPQAECHQPGGPVEELG